MSNEKKYQVFISSTYTDLIEARREVINLVLKSYNFPVGMEMFGADNDAQWAIIKDAIDVSDYYILILGHRYGSISKADGISFTEKEFDYAIAQGVNTVCFIRNDNVATKPHEREEDPLSRELLTKFREKVKTDRVCEFWDSVDDLKQKISMSLLMTIQRHGGVGWVRGDKASGELAEEIARLSKENGILREENERLKQSVDVRKPNLTVMINGIDSLNDTEVINLKIRELIGSECFIKPEKIPDNNFNRQWSGTGILDKSNQIGRFNTELSKITDDDVIVINEKIQEFYQLDQGLTEFNIQIKNNGSSLAKNVDIEIELPEIVKLIDDLSSRSVKKLKSVAAKKIVYLPYPEGYSLPDFHDIDVPRMFMTSQIPPRPNVLIKEKILNINLDSLLHSKSKDFLRFYLYPLVRGDAVIKIKIICEEYSEPVYTEIPIKVV